MAKDYDADADKEIEVLFEGEVSPGVNFTVSTKSYKGAEEKLCLYSTTSKGYVKSGPRLPLGVATEMIRQLYNKMCVDG